MRRFPLIKWSCYLGCAVVLAVLAAGLGALVWQALPVFSAGGTKFPFGTEWYYRDGEFGAMAMIYGTLVVGGVALALAVPVGIGTAVFLSEYLPKSLRLPVKSTVEMLAGVPSVVYGLLGVMFLREWMAVTLAPWDPLSGDSLMTAGVLLGVMVLPTVATLADDALRAVPSAQRAAARGLGLTRAEAVLHVVLPQAAPALVAAVLLGLGRALGETVAVFLVVGRMDNHLPSNPFSMTAWAEAGQTLTSKLGGQETHIAYGDPLHWGAMMGLALLLLLLVGVCLAAAAVMRRLAPRHNQGGAA